MAIRHVNFILERQQTPQKLKFKAARITKLTRDPPSSTQAFCDLFAQLRTQLHPKSNENISMAEQIQTSWLFLKLLIEPQQIRWEFAVGTLPASKNHLGQGQIFRRYDYLQYSCTDAHARLLIIKFPRYGIGGLYSQMRIIKSSIGKILTLS